MKRIFITMLAAAMFFSMTGCNRNNTNNGTDTPSTIPETSVSVPDEASEIESSGEREDLSLESMLQSIRDAYGEDYLSNVEIPSEALEQEFGLTEDMYDEVVAEMPMMSTHPDRIVIVKAAEGRADEVEQALRNAHRDKMESELQYPVNIAKTNAAQVLRHGDYVSFLLVGAPNSNLEYTEEEDSQHAQNEIQKAIDAFNKHFA